MNRIKRIIASLLMILLVGTGVSLEAKAASGQLMFSDPSTSVGEKVEVTVKITSWSEVGDVELNLNYDPEYLRLIVEEDSSITGEDGHINLKTTQAATTEFAETLNFYALQEGSTTINVEGMTVTDMYGEVMDMTEGSSAVSIAAGDPSKIPAAEGEKKELDTPEVHLDGKVYRIAQFSDVEIPDGFVRATLSYEGQECDCIKLENGGTHAFFLTADEGETSSIFLYDGDTGSFTPVHMLSVSSDNFIILLRDENNEISINDPYQETSITIGEDTFPAWQNPEDGDFYLVYALNKNGKKLIYRYDSVEKTYQRFAVDTEAVEEEEPLVAETALDEFVQTNWKIFAVAGTALILFLLITLLVVRIKLARRDRELDDLYDEYGIDLPEEVAEADQKKKQNKSKVNKKSDAGKKSAKEEEFEEEELEEVVDDSEGFEEYNEEEELSEEGFETAEISLGAPEEKAFDEEDIQVPEVRDPSNTTNFLDEEDASLDLEEETILDDNGEIEDLDELLDIKPEKRRGHFDEDDTFKVSFIDLE
ncbi:MAG: cohesin domain-containing protein [Dorea sp.]|nr:cohesin domain-containing protein [Dorea sp.]